MADLDLTEDERVAALCALPYSDIPTLSHLQDVIDVLYPIIERQVKARERAEAVQNLRAVFGVTNRAATWLERNRPATTGEAGQ